jgi:hypothetical protein
VLLSRVAGKRGLADAAEAMHGGRLLGLQLFTPRRDPSGTRYLHSLPLERSKNIYWR